MRRPVAAILTVLAVLCAAPLAAAPDVDPDRLARTVNELTALGTRMPGYPGHDRARAWVEREMAALGYGAPRRQDFSVLAPVEREAWLQGPDGKKLPVHGLWPNWGVPPDTGPRGLAGPLIYAPECRMADFNGFDQKDLKNAIILTEFNTGQRWMTAPLLGARAVIFIAPEDTWRAEAEAKFLYRPVAFPRYWIDRSAGLALRDKLRRRDPRAMPVRLKGRMVWESAPAANLSWTLGKPSKDNRQLVVAARLDSISAVPSLAPGAEAAGNLGVFLEAARAFKARAPRRPVTFILVDANGLQMKGWRELIDAQLAAKAWKDNLFLVVDLDLTSRAHTLGVFYKGHFYDQYMIVEEFMLQGPFTALGGYLREWAEKQGPARGLDSLSLVEGLSNYRGRNWREFLSAPLALGCEVPNLAGLAAISLAGAHDVRRYVDTPLDQAARLDLPGLARQGRIALNVLDLLANDPAAPAVRVPETFFSWAGGLTAEPNLKNVKVLPPVPGVHQIIARRDKTFKTYAGVRGGLTERSDARGHTYFKGVNGAEPSRYIIVEAFRPGPEGRPDYFMDFGEEGKRYPFAGHLFQDKPFTAEEMSRTTRYNPNVTSVLFPGTGCDVWGLVDPRQHQLHDSLSMLDAASDVGPRANCTVFMGMPYESQRSDGEPVGAVATLPGVFIKLLVQRGVLGVKSVLLNNTEADPKGIGFPIEKTPQIDLAPFRFAHDLWIIDDYRMKGMARSGIINERLLDLHRQAKVALGQAEQFLKLNQYDKFLAAAQDAMALESRAYPDVQSTADDVMKAVIFYLALLLPFSFFAERLFLAYTDIRRQITATAVIFVGIFFIMRYVHPAFDITPAPLIILLAFLLMTLGSIVLVILMGRFETEMRKIREGGRQAADVGRVSAAGAAFMLGIANMRRRKVRTVLTCVTLILLTFTVLSFTSVKTLLRYNQVPLDKTKTPGYAGAMLKQGKWDALNEAVVESVSNEFSQKYLVCPRAWINAMDPRIKSLVQVRRTDRPEAAYSSPAVMGFTPEEDRLSHQSRYLKAGRWFRPGEELVCILPDSMARLLGIGAADLGRVQVTVRGVRVTVVGLLDDVRYETALDLNQEPFTPVDYAVMNLKMDKLSDMDALVAKYTHTPARACLILPASLVLRLGGTWRSIALGPRQAGAAFIKPLVMDTLLPRLTLAVFASPGPGAEERIDQGRGKTSVVRGSWVFSSIGTTSIGGMGVLIVPILIAALIVLSTMMGSVYERTREIGILGSVGLAPTHISALFLAEACVYAVLGSIAGYLVGQVSAKIIATTHLLPGITLNYSSLSAVGTIMVVIAVVLLSTIYPAIQAGRMSVPDVSRKWKLDDPDGDDWRFDFPFTVSATQAAGLNVFMRQFFDLHTEASLGKFYCADIHSGAGDQGQGYRLSARAWLAPYDMGVCQDMELQTIPGPDEDIYLIKVRLGRVSGDNESWKRVNYGFLQELRKQMLIWRTVPVEEKETYTAAAGQFLEDQGVLV